MPTDNDQIFNQEFCPLPKENSTIIILKLSACVWYVYVQYYNVYIKIKKWNTYQKAIVIARYQTVQHIIYISLFKFLYKLWDYSCKCNWQLQWRPLEGGSHRFSGVSHDQVVIVPVMTDLTWILDSKTVDCHATRHLQITHWINVSLPTSPCTIRRYQNILETYH